MINRTEELRNKYIQNPPEGMTADDVRNMSDKTFWTWIIFFMKTMTLMTISEKKVSISSKLHSSISYACLCAGIIILNYFEWSNFL